MALSPRIAIAVGNSMANSGVGAITNSGKIRIYDGAQPATPDTAISGQNLLVELPLSATAFASAVAGVITANAIGPAVATHTATATWFRMLTSANVAVMDGSVGTSGCDMNLNSVAIVSGDTIALTSCTITVPLL